MASLSGRAGEPHANRADAMTTAGARGGGRRCVVDVVVFIETPRRGPGHRFALSERDAVWPENGPETRTPETKKPAEVVGGLLDVWS
jgi:hypothetical protein